MTKSEMDELRDEMADRYIKEHIAYRQIPAKDRFRAGFDARHALSSSDIPREDVNILIAALKIYADGWPANKSVPADVALAVFNEKYGEK